MATAYQKRYVSGFTDNDGSKPVDDDFLNAVEAALLVLLGNAPATNNHVPAFSSGTDKLVWQLLTNDHVAAAAAIAYSKLALTGLIVNADIAAAAAIAYSKLNLAGGIVNADISTSAAIAISKLAGYPGDATKYPDGSGNWSTPVAGATLTTAENALAADVTMTNANQYYDGPSISCAAGTWLLVSTVTIVPNSAAQITAKLWDGTTNEASTDTRGASGGQAYSLSVSGIVAPGSTTTYKTSVAASTAGAAIKAAAPDNAAGNTASHIRAIKVG